MESVSMKEVKEKLLNLKQYMPNQVEVTYSFGNYLASRLPPRAVPMGFIMAAMLLLHDLETGVDGFTDKPIKSSLVGYPPQIYNLLSAGIPSMAQAVCPECFAEDVRKQYDLISAQAKEKVE